MGFFSWLFRRRKREVKLGLALGSGGAKGFAELGAIRAFEENGIEFDYIAGSSIGSIIGAFIANGYSAEEMSELIKDIDLTEVRSLFMNKMEASKMFSFIHNTIGSLNIEDLKKPFSCVATDYKTGEEKVFDSGNVSKALCASSSYPPFFKPVVIGDNQYVDGGFTNSVPADVVKSMGADYVVGIDLSNHKTKQGLLSKLFSFDKGVLEPWKKGYENADVMLNPDLSMYKSVSIGGASDMYQIGYECALKYVVKIKEDIRHFKKKRK